MSVIRVPIIDNSVVIKDLPTEILINMCVDIHEELLFRLESGESETFVAPSTLWNTLSPVQ